jgi:hypothetical protein
MAMNNYRILSKTVRVLSACTGGALMLAVAGIASAQTPPPTQIAENYYGAGNHIVISTPMPRDVIVAGREIEINQPVTGDILAAGWKVALSAHAQDDVRIAAGEIHLNAPIDGDLTIAGGDITLGPDTHVSGRSWITGRAVRVDGVVERQLRVAGETIVLAGEIRQPVEIVGEKLEIRSTARVLAPLTYKGPVEAQIEPGAVINEPVTFNRIEAREARRARAFPAASTLLFSIHLFLAGLLVVMFLPRVETSVIETLRAEPGKSLVVGFVALVTVPVAAVLLVISVLGLPIGLALGGTYAVALFVSVVATALSVGALEARLFSVMPGANRGQHVLWLLAGVMTLAILRAAFGAVIVFGSILFGLGALMLAVYHAYAASPMPAAS